MDTLLTIEHLHKKFGSLHAVNDVSFTIKKGSVYGILGPNGSGKSTTLGIILNVVNKTSGNFYWFDGSISTHAALKNVGAIIERPNFYPYMTAADNLELVCKIKNISYENIDKRLEQVNLLERKNSKFSTFSLGMKQRLAIASALLNDPEILILDEPTNGLDPKGIHEIRQIIQEISKTGTTILLASHLLDEVEKVCDHVIVLQKGKMLYSGPVDEMGIHSDTIIIKANEKDTVISELLTQIAGVTKFHKDGENWVLEVEKDIETHSVNEYFIKNKIVLSHLEKRKTKLEEKFLHLTSD
ncbi:MAG: ATP-binding cassette domain-containing protein [Lutimonas sp.]